MWFWASEVTHAAKCLERGTDLTSVAQHALQALTKAHHLEKQLTSVLELLGAHYEPLSVEPAAIEALYERAEFILRTPTDVMTAQQVREWAYAIASVNRGYMLLVSLLTGTSQPWQALLLAAEKILSNSPKKRFEYDPELALAYGLLATARKGLKEEAYLLCREGQGERAATMAFPDMESRDVNTTILSLLRE